MLQHYLKIAFRNQWKYKSQTLISVLGLAVGFTCFALATLWIRYEMTYDGFHKNAKQMYVVYQQDRMRPTDYNRKTSKYLSSYLKETFPEVANATSLIPDRGERMVMLDGKEYPALIINADSSFFQMFDIKILDGSWEFIIPGSNKIAITSEKARQLFGKEHPIGKVLDNGRTTICAVVSGMSKQSNYPFDFIKPLYAEIEYPTGKYPIDMSTSTWGENTILELYPETDIKAFEKKLFEHKKGNFTNKLLIVPLTKLHYTGQDIERNVKIDHIYIFAVSGLLVVLCSLFNYLTLFISRFRIRQKELALRMVCGASGCSLFIMLSVEFLLTLLFSVALGCLMMKLILGTFLTLSTIQMNLPVIYKESFLYIGGITIVSILTFWMILLIFRHRSLIFSFRRSNKKLFRKTSVVIQLVISIGFAFCTIIILKQMVFLQHTNDLGFSFENRGSISTYNVDKEIIVNQLKQIPEIIEVVDATGMTVLLPASRALMNSTFSSWDNQPVDVETMSIEGIYFSTEYISFYDLRLVTGEMLTAIDPDTLVLLNESAVKAFGWNDPVGKNFASYTVKGVIKNVYNFAPTIEAKPVYYTKYSRSARERSDANILFKYREDTWKSCREKIEQLIEKEYPSNRTTIYNAEEEYKKYLKSENALIKLLSFVSAICILICIFGFVSLVSLTCEERRKSIAIRKINGATVGDILAIFAKEYFLLLLLGAAIAFPAGYIIMKGWLEQYVKQTSIPAWIYLSIIFVMALIIVLCVGWQVYRASVENPAEVVKKE